MKKVGVLSLQGDFAAHGRINRVALGGELLDKLAARAQRQCEVGNLGQSLIAQTSEGLAGQKQDSRFTKPHG